MSKTLTKLVLEDWFLIGPGRQSGRWTFHVVRRCIACMRTIQYSAVLYARGPSPASDGATRAGCRRVFAPGRKLANHYPDRQREATRLPTLPVAVAGVCLAVQLESLLLVPRVAGHWHPCQTYIQSSRCMAAQQASGRYSDTDQFQGARLVVCNYFRRTGRLMATARRGPPIG